jgi:hypothetical protein
MLSKIRVLQTIEDGKRRLDIEGVTFEVEYAQKPEGAGKRAEIIIWSRNQAKIVLYPNATLFSVRHELCHMKLFRMGILLTNTKRDRQVFRRAEDYMRIVLIVEWYINELQKRVFQEYYAVDKAGTPRPPPFPGLPELPKERFSQEQVRLLTKLARKGDPGLY